MPSETQFRFSDYTQRRLEIIDTTLREGAQTSLLHDHHRHFFSQRDKAEIARALIVYGVKFVELFAPVVSPRERADISIIQAVRDDLITQKGYTFLLAHVRCHPADIESAIDVADDIVKDTAADIMEKPTVVRTTDKLVTAFARMYRDRLTGIPVVDAEGLLVGYLDRLTIVTLWPDLAAAG